MKILILDDVQRRLDVFRAMYEAQGHEVVTVMKYYDCIAQLEAHQWDLVHLDHDLGEFVDDADFYLDGKGQRQFYTGSHVVGEIIARTFLHGKSVPNRVIVHSINPRGAHMRDDLNRYGIPTTWEPYVDPGDENV
jgi:hypothetical protein